jgi:hypothetical protein
MYASAQNALAEAAKIAPTARFVPRVDQLIRQRNITLMLRTAAAMAFCLSALALGGYWACWNWIAGESQAGPSAAGFAVTTRSRPLLFASYSATSAAFTSWSRSAPESGNAATPKEAVTAIDWVL